MNPLLRFNPEPFEDFLLELENEKPAGAPTRPIRARILWPALGFPAVIAPRDPPAPSAMSDADATRCICILMLSDRRYLSKADAARYLRYAPWAQRGRRHIAAGQAGSFNETDLEVKNDVSSIPDKEDAFGIWIAFGGDKDGANVISVNLAKCVKEFYSKRGISYLHEIRINEAASGRLKDGQYHLFWNNDVPNEQAPSDEMTLLLREHAQPLRQKLGQLWQQLSTYLLQEYEFEYGAIHPPYQKRMGMRLTRAEILHPLFVRRRHVGTLKIGHITDTHVDVRADVYEENLKRSRVALSYPKWSPQSFNNWNRSFVQIYNHAKDFCDVLLITGDLIDYGRGHWGLVAGHRLGDDCAYHEDRNWFLFYYLLASGDAYRQPAYTILGNHDWRLNPYPPFAPGAPSPEVLINNYAQFSKAEREDVLRKAHGKGYDRQFSYNLQATSAIKTIAGFLVQAQSTDQKGLPTETKVDSVLWYLYSINPFFDYYFALPTGHKVLMLDWGKDENVLFPIVERGKSWPYLLWQVQAAAYPGPKAKRSLTDRQWRLVSEFIESPGAAKVIGIHAPPIGPYPYWFDSDLMKGRKVYDQGTVPQGATNYATRFPDGTIQRWNGHPLFAVKPNNDAEGIAADYGSFERLRSEFLGKVSQRGAGVRLIFSGHIHRNGLYVAYVPEAGAGAAVAGKMLIKARQEEFARGARPPAVTWSPDGKQGPLFVNTTSAGPRGHFLPAPNQAAEVDPGYTYVELANDGTIQTVNFRWPMRGTTPTAARPASPQPELGPLPTWYGWSARNDRAIAG